MRYDKTLQVTDFYGAPVTGLHPPPDDKSPFTYGDLFVSALGLGLPNDRGEEKLRSYKLGLKFLEPDSTIELNDVETNRLRLLTGTLYNALLHGRACDYLDRPLPKTPDVAS